MRISLCVLAAILAVTMCCLPTSAQNVQDGLDLPIMPPVYGQPKQPQPIPPPPPGEDPRDEPLPVFFGEELESPTKSIIYVIDTSGSMQSHVQPGGPSRMALAQKELCRSIDSLPDDYTFNVIEFNFFILPWRMERQQATSANKSAAKSWVMGLLPGFATATGPAVAYALHDRANKYIVLLTDGAPTFPESDPAWHRNLIRNNNVQRAAIHVFGINASGDMRGFCMGVASDSGGSYVDIY